VLYNCRLDHREDGWGGVQGAVYLWAAFSDCRCTTPSVRVALLISAIMNALVKNDVLQQSRETRAANVRGVE
jgi:1,4-dihydroxy-2-naphthoate octaprenyltransferase